MPTPTANSSGNIGIMNTASKYGGPTEILPLSMASRINGYSVPSRISPAAMHRSRLFTTRKVSRENALKPMSLSSRGARQA